MPNPMYKWELPTEKLKNQMSLMMEEIDALETKHEHDVAELEDKIKQHETTIDELRDRIDELEAELG